MSVEISQMWSSSVQIWPNSPEVDRFGAKLDPHRTGLARIRPKLGRFSAKFGAVATEVWAPREATSEGRRGWGAALRVFE